MRVPTDMKIDGIDMETDSKSIHDPTNRSDINRRYRVGKSVARKISKDPTYRRIAMTSVATMISRKILTNSARVER